MRLAGLKSNLAAIVSLQVICLCASHALAIGPVGGVNMPPKKPVAAAVKPVIARPTDAAAALQLLRSRPTLAMSASAFGFWSNTVRVAPGGVGNVTIGTLDPRLYPIGTAVFNVSAISDTVVANDSEAVPLFTQPAGGFSLNLSNPTNEDGYSTYVLSAKNTGVDGTGTRFLAFELDLTTNGVGTDGAIKLTPPRMLSDGVTDVDVLGKAGETFGSIDGTFMGIAASSDSDSVSSNFISFTLDSTDHFGSWDGTTVNNELHSLSVVGLFAGAANGTYAADAYVPFANIVVPTGTFFDASGMLGGDTGGVQNFDITDASFVSPPPAAVAPVNIIPQSLASAAIPEPGTLAMLLPLGILCRGKSRTKSG